jgi:ABC-2 type transport system ATP-binding protein
MSGEKAISVHGLTRKFGGLTAVDNVSFDVEEGDVFGLLGLNGAGKTTTVLMLATLLNPTFGSATLCGFDIVRERNEVRKSIGIVFEEPSLDIQLTGKENLDFHARMYNLSKKIREERIERALDLVDLNGWENTVVKNYSGGMQRRLEIARGLLNYPKVLFLDEPTVGLDVQTRRYLWDYVRKLNQELSMTILLTTSYTEEAAYLCNHIAIIGQGKIVITGTPQGLEDSIGTGLVSLRLSQGSNQDFVRLLSRLPWVKKVKEQDGALELSVTGRQAEIPELVRLARNDGFVISSISSHKPSLNDVLLHYTGRVIKESKALAETTRRGRRW